MSINNLYSAQYRFEGAGGGFTCQQGFQQLSGTNDENTLTDLAVDLAVTLEADFLAVMSNQIRFTSILTYQVTGSNETPGRTRFEAPNQGSVISEAIPLGGAAVLSMLTDAPSARFNGRMFVAGVPESFEAEGALTGAAITAYETLSISLGLTTPAIGPGLAVFEPRTISRILNGVPRVPPVGFTVTSITPDPFIKNQRRRNTRFLGFGGTT